MDDANQRQMEGQIERLYAEEYEGCYRVAALVMPGLEGAVDDVVQEAFLSLCRNWDHVADPRSYLYGTVIRRSRDHVRGITRRRSLLERLVSAHGPPAAGGEGGGEGEGEGPSPIDLSALRPRHREAIVLHYYLDLPVDEVAALLDRPVGTIKTWLSRGRKELRPLLAARSPT